MTATVPLCGKTADLYSKRLLIQLSLSLFVAGSLIAGFTPNVEILIVSRVALGVGAGGMSTLALIVMAAMIPPRELGRYSGMFGAVFGVATIAGPLIGGVLVDTSWLGWRWCFFIGVPFSLAAIALLQRTLNLPSVPRKQVPIDVDGGARRRGRHADAEPGARRAERHARALHTLSSDERRTREEAAAGVPLH